jgi:hypothetical protein
MHRHCLRRSHIQMFCGSIHCLQSYDVVYRRAQRRKASAAQRQSTLTGPVGQSGQLPLELVDEEATRYGYAVYVTSLAQPAGGIHALYNPRADNENCYDELKN